MVEHADTSVSTMAKCYLWITSAAGSANSLHPKDTHEDVTGYMAILPRQASRLSLVHGG